MKRSRKVSEETKRKISRTMKGRKRGPMSLATKQKLSLVKTGTKHSDKTRRKLSKSNMGHVVTPETRQKISNARRKQAPPRTGKMSDEHKRKIGLANSGAKSNFWQGGITALNSAVRNSLEYKLWRSAIFERDGYTCQHCGQLRGKIQADHIEPFSLYPELRFDVSNGRTLCEACHKKTDTWGFKLRKYKEKINA